MLKPLCLGSCMLLCIVGCTHIDEKSITPPAQPRQTETAQPVTSVAKPRLKTSAKAAIKPNSSSAFPVAASATDCPHIELGEQWASCSAMLAAFYEAGIHESKLKSKKVARTQQSVDAFNLLPFLSEVYLAYASAATTPNVVATKYQLSYNQQRQYADNVFRKKASPLPLFKTLRRCNLSLQEQHRLFDATVAPQMRYSVLDQKLQSFKPGNL